MQYQLNGLLIHAVASHTNSDRCTGIPNSDNISGSHRHCILLHMMARGSECVLTWTACARMWSWVSWHRNWRPSSIGEDVMSWWILNAVCYHSWGLKGRKSKAYIDAWIQLHTYLEQCKGLAWNEYINVCFYILKIWTSVHEVLRDGIQSSHNHNIKVVWLTEMGINSGPLCVWLYVMCLIGSLC